jgi:hypothetical protein
MGVLCESCQPGFIKRGLDHICSPCGADNTQSDVTRVTGIFMGIALGVLVLGILVVYRMRAVYLARVNGVEDLSLARKLEVLLERCAAGSCLVEAPH